ncbi:hypothetical protein [Brachybacterium hainanense]|uniref:Secreted protein n=1 Tax=Brachybacterium hainanense TaxID=1541174 RepID=A0ABV6R8B1_9MICO
MPRPEALIRTAVTFLAITSLTACSLFPGQSDDVPSYRVLDLPRSDVDSPPPDLLDESFDAAPESWRAASLRTGAQVYLGGTPEALCTMLVLGPEDGGLTGCDYVPAREPTYMTAPTQDGRDVVVYTVDDTVRSVEVDDVVCVAANNVVLFEGLGDGNATATIHHMDGTTSTVDFPSPELYDEASASDPVGEVECL